MNVRKKNLRMPLDKVLPTPSPNPTEELERRVSKLENDVALLRSLSGWPGFTDAEITEQKRRPGPKEKISDEDLFCYRDGLVLWLEPIWPWMVDRIPAARSSDDIRALLEAVAETPESRPDWQNRLLQNAATLFEFLQDERFRKTQLPKATVTEALTLAWEDERPSRAANQLPTRQIANAMAGVPDIVWRTSLDRCSEQPAPMLIAVNLDMYYRDRFSIPGPTDCDLTGVWCPVPKSCHPISAQSGDQVVSTQDSAAKATGVENESSGAGHARAR